MIDALGTKTAAPARTITRPRLVFFYSSRSGRCRRVEGFLAQVLQHRRNHGTFSLYRVEQEERPDLVERFGIESVPAIAVVEDNVVRARLEVPADAARSRRSSLRG